MKVVNLKKAELQKRGYKDIHDWLKNPKHLYIGRKNHHVGVSGSIWGNPFPLSKYSLQESLKLYEEHVLSNLYNRLDELRDYEELGCWCANDKDTYNCHGHVLLKLLNENN